MMFDIKDKVAIVTGANTGLGQAICVAYAKAGAKVLGVARRSCAETKAKIDAIGGIFNECTADLSSTTPIDNIIKTAIDLYGTVDILVNNAGIIKRADAVDVTEEDWDSVINVNQKVVFFLSQAFAKVVFAQNKKGKIINIASMLSFFGGYTVPAYAASKGGVAQVTKALCNEWAEKGINVNALAPGYMATEMNTALLDPSNPRNAAITNRIPKKEWGTPDDMKGPVVWLASDASDYINGAVIPVDGGYLVR